MFSDFLQSIAVLFRKISGPILQACPNVSWNPGGGPTYVWLDAAYYSINLDPVPEGKEFSPVFVSEDDFQGIIGVCSQIVKSIKTKPTFTWQIKF